jgi:hypothetical protein
MIFYKAVRPDGKDFYSGTVDYAAICGTGEQLPELPGGPCCSPDVYHASTSKADTLIGGSWPCRLFEVDGEPVSEEKNKRGFCTLTVVRELPAWEALGPNGEAVVCLIEKCRTITPQTANQLNAARNAARDAAWDAAGYAARDAAGALVVRDLVAPEQFDILTAPWVSVMGEI